MKSPSILEIFNLKLRKNTKKVLLCLQLTRNVLFNRNMDNFKFNFLSWGQLESLNLDRRLILARDITCFVLFSFNLD